VTCTPQNIQDINKYLIEKRKGLGTCPKKTALLVKDPRLVVVRTILEALYVAKIAHSSRRSYLTVTIFKAQRSFANRTVKRIV
jgi:hypothetical protein